MIETEDRIALTAAISSCEREIASMHASVPLLETAEPRRIEDACSEGERWRGLAADDFTSMMYALVVPTRN